MSINEIFTQLTNLDLCNDFTEQLQLQYQFKNSLSQNQVKCLQNIIYKYKTCDSLLSNCEPDYYLLESFKKQFILKKYLSIKQIACLEKNQIKINEN